MLPFLRPGLWLPAALLSLFATFLPATDQPAATTPEPFISDTDWQRGAVPAAERTAGEATAVEALVRLAGALAVIAALAVGAGYILRRAARGRLQPARTGKHLQLVETVPLGIKRSVAVMRLGGHLILVGQHEQGLVGLGVVSADGVDFAAPVVSTVAPAGVPAGADPVAPPSTPVAPSPFSALIDRLAGPRP